VLRASKVVPVNLQEPDSDATLAGGRHYEQEGGEKIAPQCLSARFSNGRVLPFSSSQGA
jgi:hypothetical protein